MTQWQPKTGSEHPARTEAGKMRLRRLADGWVSDHWPPDAKVLVEAGTHEFVEVKPTRDGGPPRMPVYGQLDARSQREAALGPVIQAIREEPVRRRP